MGTILKRMSFRDEIKSHVKEILIDQDCDWAANIDIDKYSNSILKKFENRINSVKDLKDDHNYSGDDEFIDGFDLGFDHALTKLNELLK